MATTCAPWRRKSASVRCTVTGSGVVWVASDSAPKKPLPTVPISAAFCPSRVKACASQVVIEVLPLVPVTPITVSASLGWPSRKDATTPARARRSGTGRLGTVQPGCHSKPSAGSHATATAPRAMASAM